MSDTAPPKKLNGRKRKGNLAACPHVEVCNAPAYHSDVMAVLDVMSRDAKESLEELSRSVGLLLEQTQQHSDRIIAVAERLHDVSQRQVVADQREAEWLNTLNGMTRAVAAMRQEARDA